MPAKAALIFSNVAPDTSNAAQAQNAILTVQRQGGATTESACVLIDSVLLGSNYVYSPCPSGFTGGDHVASSSQTFSAGSQNILNAADLRITFDAVQSSGDSITIDRLTLYFWTPGGVELVPGGISLSPQPYTLDTTLAGSGKADVTFKLDPQSISDLTLAGFNSNTIIGVAVNMSSVSGGAEGFYLSNVITAEGVPEPSTWVLTLTALAGWTYRRRKR